MTKLLRWAAKRSGPQITINGVDADTGERRQIAAVSIERDEARGTTIATDKNGDRHELA